MTNWRKPHVERKWSVQVGTGSRAYFAVTNDLDSVLACRTKKLLLKKFGHFEKYHKIVRVEIRVVEPRKRTRWA